MIISDKYKYVFIELPRTGTTAISKELCELYSGKQILKKHSTYQRFLKYADDEQKKYYVFSCIRNPVDRTFSLYTKLKYKDENYYHDLTSNRNKLISNYYFKKRINWIKEHNADFIDYLKYFYKWPYSDWSILSHKDFNFVIRFESLQEGFSKVLKALGIKQERLLPIVNKTVEKRDDIIDYYLTEKNYDLFLKIFGPFMLYWNYDYPFHPDRIKISKLDIKKYIFINIFRKFYWKNIK